MTGTSGWHRSVHSARQPDSLSWRSRATLSRGSPGRRIEQRSPAMGINVFVVDQERTFADALAARLEAESDVEVVAAVHARTPAQCLILGRQADVMLLDGDLPERAAIRLCEELRWRDEAPRVIILSNSSEAERIVDAVRAGAAGWVRKDESFEHLVDVIRRAARGGRWRIGCTCPPTLSVPTCSISWQS